MEIKEGNVENNNIENVEVLENVVTPPPTPPQEPKKTSMVLPIVFFILLGGFVFGLPYFGDIIDRFRNINIDIDNPDNNGNNNNDDEEILNRDPIPMTGATFTVNDVEFSNFILSNNGNDYKISFSATTANANGVSLHDADIFLELYSANNTLLERIKVERNTTVLRNSVVNLEFLIKGTTHREAANILMLNKSPLDYPMVSLTIDGEGNEFLICVNNNQTIRYLFNDSKLHRIEDRSTFTQGDDLELYTSLLNDKKILAENLNRRDGFVSTVTYTDNGFIITTTIDLANATVDRANFPFYYDKDTEARVVAFEMRARRFICN